MAKPHKIQPLTNAEAVKVATQVDAQRVATESAALPLIDCCARCKFFQPKSKTYGDGLCRALPPQRTSHNSESSTSGWPHVLMGDFCGSFSVKP